MKYSEIVGVDQFFDSTFNITEEKQGYWKQFISNKKYEDNLLEILHTFTSGVANNRKSIWIQGTYGTGKSHSTAVTMHLLSDDIESVEEYAEKIQNPQLRSELISFRKKQKVMPIVLKGTNEIVDTEELKYVIQREVTKQLAGYDITVQSDFEAIASMVDDPRFASFWEAEFNGELGKYATTTDELLHFLDEGDVDILKEITEALKKANLMKATENIKKWLSEVAFELRRKGIADYLVIFWDEFTSLLDIAERRSILNTMQDIAELSKAPTKADEPGEYIGVYVFLVTHKNLETMDSYKELKEDEKTMAKSRFLLLSYDMVDITTYHILSNAIKVRDAGKHNELINERIAGNISISETLDLITEKFDKATETKKTIELLYPFHPYTAYLATFVSTAIGSAERSIFEFLNDEKRGFKHFIESDINDLKFITIDYVWDFFFDAFSQDRTNNFDAMISKYNIHIPSITKMGKVYEVVFKSLLLLNLLSRVTAVDSEFQEKNLVIPSEKNVYAALSGAWNNQEIEEALSYINDSQIIIKNPEGIYEISTSSMPVERVQKAKKDQYLRYEDISRVFTEDYPVTFGGLKTQISRTISRVCSIDAFSGYLSQTRIESILLKKFTSPYSLNIALVFFRGETTTFDKMYNKPEPAIALQKNVIAALSEKPEFKNIVFVVIDQTLGNTAFEAFIDNKAKEVVANELSMAEEKDKCIKNSEMWINEWKDKIISSGKCTIIFRNQKIDASFSEAGKKVENKVLPIIFKYGLDRIESIGSAKTAWPEQNAKKMVEHVCFSNTRTEFEGKCTGAALAVKNLLRNESDSAYIFDETLSFVGDVNSDDPMTKLINVVDDVIEKAKGKAVVNIGEELAFLVKPEYGYYNNYVCMAAVALAMRRYTEKIYRADQGTLIDAIGMKDLVSAMFAFWKQGKQDAILRVRFSTNEEKELIELLQDIFKVQGDGIVMTKWQLRSKFERESNAPLWVLKDHDNKSPSFCKLIDLLFEMVIKPNDKIKQESISELLNGLKMNKMEVVSALAKTKTNNYLIQFINKCFNEVGYNTDDYDFVINYLQQEMQENVAFWQESKLRETLYKLAALQRKDTKPEEKPAMVVETIPEDETKVDEPETSDEFNSDDDVVDFEAPVLTPIGITGRTHATIQGVTEKINKTEFSDSKSKRLLTALCKEYPVICDKLMTLLDKE